MKRVGARTVLLGVLERKSIHAEQMRFPEGWIAVFAFQHGVEHGIAALEAVKHECTTITA